jgi:hypothetical protein
MSDPRTVGITQRAFELAGLCPLINFLGEGVVLSTEQRARMSAKASLAAMFVHNEDDYACNQQHRNLSITGTLSTFEVSLSTVPLCEAVLEDLVTVHSDPVEYEQLMVHLGNHIAEISFLQPARLIAAHVRTQKKKRKITDESAEEQASRPRSLVWPSTRVGLVVTEEVESEVGVIEHMRAERREEKKVDANNAVVKRDAKESDRVAKLALLLVDISSDVHWPPQDLKIRIVDLRSTLRLIDPTVTAEAAKVMLRLPLIAAIHSAVASAAAAQVH